MIYVRLAGGLGNQLFQILHAISISRPGEKIIVLTDSLNKFTTSRAVEFTSLIEYDSLRVISQPSILSRIFISKLRLGKFLHIFDRQLHAISFFFDSFGIVLPKIVDGYFQDPSPAEIDQFFRLVSIKPQVTNTYLKYIAHGFDCCLHLRGGDFLLPQNSHLNICKLDYYLSAVQLAFHDGAKSFLIVGNDYNYSISLRNSLRVRFPSCKFIVHNENLTTIQDFLLMTYFKSFVLSSSTFCWWAARFACLHNNDVAIYGPSFFDIHRLYPRFPCRHVAAHFNPQIGV